MKFSIINDNPAYASADVYWAILGLNSDNVFAWVNSDGTMTPISTNDNTNMINGVGYANYFTPLSTASSVEISELMTSGRVYISLGDWLPIQVNSPTGYAPPSSTNPSVPGYNTIFDKFEFTYQPGTAQEMNCNTTSVDFLGIPINAELKSSVAPLSQKVGFTASRSAIQQAFASCPDSNFASLIIPGASSGDPALRILSPEHAMNTVLPQPIVNYFNSFFDSYLTDCWTYYTQNTLTLQINSAMYTGPVTGQVDGSGNFVFYTGTSIGTGSPVLSLRKPTSMEALNCNGVLASGNELQMDIEKFIAAAINRTVFKTSPGSSNWCGSSSLYYANAPVEYYSQILHANSLNDLCYGFGFDDVCEQSASMQSAGTAQEVILTLPSW